MLLESILGITLSSSNPTFDKDVKPLFEKHCAQCHSANWPDKNWLDYETAKKNKDKIKLRVQNLTMPPGNMTNMTKEERDIIIKWVDQGAKK